MKMGELLEAAYLEGFRRGLECYAYWQNGRQFVGTRGTSLSEAQKLAPEDARPHFDIWLCRQREMFSREEEGGALNG